jgi:S1-C subfamily serine protease
MKVKLHRNVITLLVAVVFFTGFTACDFSDTDTDQGSINGTLSNFQTNQGTTTALDSNAITNAASKVIPAVVGITATRIDRTLANDNRRVQGVGSGVIIDNRGYILTNNHVAGGAESLEVSLYDGRNVKGKAVWTDPILDLAIVKVTGDNLPVAALGNSQDIKIGQDAIAIGNPLGLTFQRTVTAGIISAVNRTIEVESGVYMEDLIQTDASINQGNSGGPLINSRGEVVGINTVKILIAEGMGFAVPVNVVKPVISKITNGEKYAVPNVGLQAFDKELSKVFGFTADKGVYVWECKNGGCAFKHGIRKGDLVLAVDGKEVNTALELKEALFSAGAGKQVRMRIRNGEGEKDVLVTLDGME